MRRMEHLAVSVWRWFESPVIHEQFEWRPKVRLMIAAHLMRAHNRSNTHVCLHSGILNVLAENWGTMSDQSTHTTCKTLSTRRRAFIPISSKIRPIRKHMTSMTSHALVWRIVLLLENLTWDPHLRSVTTIKDSVTKSSIPISPMLNRGGSPHDLLFIDMSDAFETKSLEVFIIPVVLRCSLSKHALPGLSFSWLNFLLSLDCWRKSLQVPHEIS